MMPQKKPERRKKAFRHKPRQFPSGKGGYGSMDRAAAKHSSLPKAAIERGCLLESGQTTHE